MYVCRRSDVFLVVITIVDDIFKPGVAGDELPVRTMSTMYCSYIREARVVVAVMDGVGGAGAGAGCW